MREGKHTNKFSAAAAAALQIRQRAMMDNEDCFSRECNERVQLLTSQEAAQKYQQVVCANEENSER